MLLVLNLSYYLLISIHRGRWSTKLVAQFTATTAATSAATTATTLLLQQEQRWPQHLLELLVTTTVTAVLLYHIYLFVNLPLYCFLVFFLLKRDKDEVQRWPSIDHILGYPVLPVD